ncbi:glutathione S-transferase zeta class-like [Wolffia australiana]
MSSSLESAGADESKKLTLYSYWRSSCSYRVRIALNLKGLEYQHKTVNLVKGEQFTPEFEKLNPLRFVPVLVDGGSAIADSFAIILYLEEKYPQHPLLPQDLLKKAINYQVANVVSSSIQPLQNLSVLNYVGEHFESEKKVEWAQHHIVNGFEALEKLLKQHAGKYATGDEIYLADVFLAPQIYTGAIRFNIDMGRYPILSRLMLAYDEIPAFQLARPEAQPDCPPSV